MKSPIVTTAAIVVGLVALYLYFLSENLGRKQQGFQPDYGAATEDERGAGARAEITRLLLNAAEKGNTKLPMMVDDETRWDAVSAEDFSLTYDYTMVNYSAEEMTAFDFTGILKPTVMGAVCADPELRFMVDNGATLVFRYAGKHGDPVGEIVVPPSGCDDH